MARALQADGVDVRVFSLTRGEAYESTLAGLGLAPTWVGRRANPLLRSLTLAAALREWRPHIVQAGHFYVNLHVTLAAKAVRALSLGAVRNDASHDVDGTGPFGRWSLRAPTGLIANSHAARRNAPRYGRTADRVLVVPNVIDVTAFDASYPGPTSRRRAGDGCVVTAVARLVHQKRLDRFLDAIATARQTSPAIVGRLVGDGPERASLECRAAELGLLPGGLEMLGERTDVPALLADSDALMLTSDHEGFPNVILEAMAASLPVITTPAGDAGLLDEDGRTGHVVPGGDPGRLAEHLLALAGDPAARDSMGRLARARLETGYGDAALAGMLRAAYRSAASWAPRRTRTALHALHLPGAVGA
jgi:glycosyltransferase involved in cell wall biosynthesis